ncbi:hypothetical protein SAMN05192585_12051 [Acetanaerobacterium elongatum]|uniref:DUF1284 domain-containing protein n=2 Tax=Acetanaerobacterium elongatum TaxID=258515 RepID=A0A1H0BT75_9FIRM|nr:hypothetical protein SAMN05192585_12051 [Acetanaerobacterium elongatum]
MMPAILLRPHHGLCITHFVGKGYSEAFVKNMQCVIQTLNSPEAMIRLTCTADSICTCCPNNKNGSCLSEPKPAVFDSRVLSLCNLSDGQTLPWEAFRTAVLHNILERGRLAKVCDGCCWLKVCLSFYNK